MSQQERIANVERAYDASTERMRDSNTRKLRDKSNASRAWMKRHYQRIVQNACDHLRKTRGTGNVVANDLVLLDNGTGAGGLLHYAHQAGVGHVDANDLSAVRVDECRRYWATQQRNTGTTMTADIWHADAFSLKTRAYHQRMVHERRRPYDIIIYHNTLHYGATSPFALEGLMAYWRTILAGDGIVLIVTVDSDNLATRLNKAATTTKAATAATVPITLTDNPFFQLRWPHPLPSSSSLAQPLETGTCYDFSFHGSFHDAPEHVINKQHLMALAEKYGFASRTCYNLGFTRENENKAPIHPEQLDTLYLYAAYCLRIN